MLCIGVYMFTDNCTDYCQSINNRMPVSSVASTPTQKRRTEQMEQGNVMTGAEKELIFVVMLDKNRSKQRPLWVNQILKLRYLN